MRVWCGPTDPGEKPDGPRPFCTCAFSSRAPMSSACANQKTPEVDVCAYVCFFVGYRAECQERQYPTKTLLGVGTEKKKKKKKKKKKPRSVLLESESEGNGHTACECLCWFVREFQTAHCCLSSYIIPMAPFCAGLRCCSAGLPSCSALPALSLPSPTLIGFMTSSIEEKDLLLPTIYCVLPLSWCSPLMLALRVLLVPAP